jgi:hypothetical protein
MADAEAGRLAEMALVQRGAPPPSHAGFGDPLAIRLHLSNKLCIGSNENPPQCSLENTAP